MWYGHGWGMALWWIVGVGGLAVVIWLAVRAGHQAKGAPSAEELLGQRYANGEIDEEEYRRRLSVLRDRPRRDPSRGGDDV